MISTWSLLTEVSQTLYEASPDSMELVQVCVCVCVCVCVGRRPVCGYSKGKES